MDQTRFDLSDPDAVSFCPTCGAGYTAGVVRCIDCDEELISRLRVEYETPQRDAGRDDSGATVRLCLVEDRLTAGFLESDLEQAGIRFFVKELGLQSVLGNLGMVERFEFVVVQQDLEQARSVMASIEELEQALMPNEESSED